VRTLRFAALGLAVGLCTVREGTAAAGDPPPAAPAAAPSKSAVADAKPLASLCGEAGPKPTAPSCERYTTVNILWAGRPRDVTAPAEPCANDPRWAALEAWTLRAKDVEVCQRGLCGGGSLYEACHGLPAKSGAVMCAGSAPQAFDCANATPPWRPGSGDMIRVHGGTYTARTQAGPSELKSYWLDRTEVTVEAYRQCVREKKCKKPKSGSGCNGESADRAQHPMNCVSAANAADFCAWAGKRLPSEAEWEWAARGREAARAQPWGSGDAAARACWTYDGNALDAGNPKSTCAVGTHPDDASLDGVVDLAGNVMEWTSDREVDWGLRRGSSVAHKTELAVIKGGSWSNRWDSSVERTGRILPATQDNDLGFRCAR
jgi:formylglycine-generating enzyme required for sulfatase activity